MTSHILYYNTYSDLESRMNNSYLLKNLTKEEIEDLIKQFPSINQILKHKINSISSHYSKLFRIRCEELNLDINEWIKTSASKGIKKDKCSIKEKNNQEIFKVNSDYHCSSHLKKRILRDNLLENKCSECGQLPEWNGKPLTLQLDHINGINDDHRLENLRLLCPNCHTQTENFAGKNMSRKAKENFCVKCNTKISRDSTWCHFCSVEEKTKSRKNTMFNLKNNIVIYPPYDEMAEMVSSYGFAAAGRKIGVSASSVKKRLLRYAKEAYNDKL